MKVHTSLPVDGTALDVVHPGAGISRGSHDRRRFFGLSFFSTVSGSARTFASVWSEVEIDAGTVQITSTLVRVKGKGLLRKVTKRRPGESTLPVPASAVAMLRRRIHDGCSLGSAVVPGCARWVPGPGQRPARAAGEARGRSLWRGSTSHTSVVGY